METNIEEVTFIIQNAIKHKTINDTTWLLSLQEKLQIEEITPKKCMSEIWHRRKLQTLKSSKQWLEYSPDYTKYSRKRIVPPRPLQTRLAITAAKKSEIITLYGPSGTGKTTAAVRAAIVASRQHDKKSVFAINGIRLSYMSKDKIDDATQEALQCPIIILDDIDKGSKGDVMINCVFDILENRNRNHWAGTVILTTNLFGPALARAFQKTNPSTGEAILRRLEENISIDFGPTEIKYQENIELIREKLKAMDANDSDWLASLEDFGKFN